MRWLWDPQVLSLLTLCPCDTSRPCPKMGAVLLCLPVCASCPVPGTPTREMGGRRDISGGGDGLLADAPRALISSPPSAPTFHLCPTPSPAPLCRIPCLPPQWLLPSILRRRTSSWWLLWPKEQVSTPPVLMPLTLIMPGSGSKGTVTPEPAQPFCLK